jgi:aminoglycoside/choline kinase family phosphotransferase
MDWPRRPPQPVLADGLSYPELVHVQDDALAFVGVAAILRDGGFRVPDIHAVDRAAGLVVMEDLGTAGLVEDERPVPDRFLAAAGILAAKDAAGLPAAVDLPGLGRWDVPVFDRRALLTELSLLPDWYLPLITGAATLPAEREAFLALWSPLIDAIAMLPAGLMLRDVIAANLVWMGGAGTQRVAFLDVQDAMVGPQAYDLMSLVTDVRLDLPASLVAEMQAAYRAVRAAADPGFDADTLEAAIALTAAQRNSKILGGFARLALRDGKRGYLAHLPLARRRVADALSHPVLQPLRLWYERHRLLD